MTSGRNELEQLLTELDGPLDGRQRARIEELLSSDESLRQYYLEYVQLHAMLQWRHGAGIDPEEPRAAPAGAVDRPRRETISNRLARGFDYRRHPVRFWGLVSLITMSAVYFFAVMLLPWLLDPEVVQPAPRQMLATLASASDAVWAGDENCQVGDELHVGDRLDLVSGQAEIRFHNGVQVRMVGASSLRLKGELTALLDLGAVIAEVPAGVRGFAVETAQGRVVDLGTEFAVEVDESGSMATSVFQGTVEVHWDAATAEPRRQTVRAGESCQLTDGRLASIDSRSREMIAAKAGPMVDVPVDPSDSGSPGDSLSESPGPAPAVRGDVRFVSPAPRILSAHNSSRRICIFLERRGVRLAHALTVQAPRFRQGRIQSRTQTLPVGTVVDSYFVVYERQSKTKVKKGVVSFGATVLGIINQQGPLAATHQLLGSPTTKYPAKPHAVESGDRVWLRTDGQSVSMRLNAGRAGDRLRILVRSQGDGPSAPASQSATTSEGASP